MQPVVEVDISVPGRPENHGGSRRHSPCRVASQIFASQVSFGLCNHSTRLAMHQQLAQQSARHLRRRAGIKASWENGIHSPIMRLFTALDLSPQVCDRLSALVQELQPLARLKWSPPANLHITTKFIGEWPLERLGELTEALPIQNPELQVTVSGVGFFPNDGHPKVLFGRVDPSAELIALAQLTDTALRQLGIAPEKHPFRPHVTLARIPQGTRIHGLRERLGELASESFGNFRATEFSLFESRAGHYAKLRTFPLQVLVR